MKVLHYTGMATSSQYGGLERWFIDFSQQGRFCGIITYLTYLESMPSRELVQAYEEAGVTVRVIPRKDRESLLGLISEESINIIIFHFEEPFDLPVFIKRKTGKKVYCFLHNDNYYSSLSWKDSFKVLLGVSWLRFKFFLSQFFVDKYFAVSDAVKQQYHSFFYLRDIKIERFYLGTDWLLVKEKANNPVPVICCVANHDYRKGVDILIQMAKILKDRNLSFVVWQVGGGLHSAKGADTRNVVSFCDSLNLSDVFKWLGIRNDIQDLLFNVDIYVQPSRREAISLTIAEAMMHRLPVVASEVDGIPEYIKDGINGFLYQNNDPVQLADKVQRLIEDEELRKIFGQKGYDTINSQLFDRIGNIQSFLANYCGVQ